MEKFNSVKILSTLYCCVLFLCGCERDLDQRVPISGTISVGDARLERGIVSFISVDNPNVVESGEVNNGVFESEVMTGEKIVRCTGYKVVGTYVPDPLAPDKVGDKLEELQANAFTPEIRIHVKRKGDYFVIQYGKEQAAPKESPDWAEMSDWRERSDENAQPEEEEERPDWSELSY